MMQIEERVRSLVEEKIADKPHLFIVDITMHKNNRLIILMDGDEGIAIGECAAISRHVGFHLEEENAIEQAYNIEVSSPGIDNPLFLQRQFAKNEGRQVSVKLQDGTTKEGKLIQKSNAHLVIEETVKEKGKKAVNQECSIPVEQIKEVKVIISFN